MTVTRRHFLIRGTIVLAGAAFGGALRPGRLLAAQAAAGNTTAVALLRFGFVTDVHHADSPPAGTRFYRDSLAKMQFAVQGLNKEAAKDSVGLSFVITLGDMIDTAAPDLNDEAVAKEIDLLKAIESEWAKVAVERHYVLGNHCIWTLTKPEFFANTKARPAPYSFDVPLKGADRSMHFVVLDACFKADGTPYGRRSNDWRDTNLPRSQLLWLADDLAKTKNPTIVFVHQRLDGSDGSNGADSTIKNAAAVRPILEKSGRVLAVLQGHSHQNFLTTVNNIPYCVLRAMVEDPGPTNNAFGTVEIFADNSIAIHGQFRQDSYDSLSPNKLNSNLSTPSLGSIHEFFK
jgi:alkaline phosphatase